MKYLSNQELNKLSFQEKLDYAKKTDNLRAFMRTVISSDVETLKKNFKKKGFFNIANPSKRMIQRYSDFYNGLYESLLGADACLTAKSYQESRETKKGSAVFDYLDCSSMLHFHKMLEKANMEIANGKYRNVLGHDAISTVNDLYRYLGDIKSNYRLKSSSECGVLGFNPEEDIKIIEESAFNKKDKKQYYVKKGVFSNSDLLMLELQELDLTKKVKTKILGANSSKILQINQDEKRVEQLYLSEREEVSSQNENNEDRRVLKDKYCKPTLAETIDEVSVYIRNAEVAGPMQLTLFDNNSVYEEDRSQVESSPKSKGAIVTALGQTAEPIDIELKRREEQEEQNVAYNNYASGKVIYNKSAVEYLTNEIESDKKEISRIERELEGYVANNDHIRVIALKRDLKNKESRIEMLEHARDCTATSKPVDKPKKEKKDPFRDSDGELNWFAIGKANAEKEKESNKGGM